MSENNMSESENITPGMTAEQTEFGKKYVNKDTEIMESVKNLLELSHKHKDVLPEEVYEAVKTVSLHVAEKTLYGLMAFRAKK